MPLAWALWDDRAKEKPLVTGAITAAFIYMASFVTASAYEDVGFTFCPMWNTLCTCELLHPDVLAFLSDFRIDAAETQLTLLHDQIEDEDHILTPYGRVTS